MNIYENKDFNNTALSLYFKRLYNKKIHEIYIKRNIDHNEVIIRHFGRIILRDILNLVNFDR
jgi:hypothetical protein